MRLIFLAVLVTFFAGCAEIEEPEGFHGLDAGSCTGGSRGQWSAVALEGDPWLQTTESAAAEHTLLRYRFEWGQVAVADGAARALDPTGEVVAEMKVSQGGGFEGQFGTPLPGEWRFQVEAPNSASSSYAIYVALYKGGMTEGCGF